MIHYANAESPSFVLVIMYELVEKLNVAGPVQC
jgi:hypothetical protein